MADRELRECEPEMGTCCACCKLVENPKECDYCEPLRDGDVSWEQPNVCADVYVIEH